MSHRTVLRKWSLGGRDWFGAYHRIVVIGGLCHKEVQAQWRNMLSFKICPQAFLSHSPLLSWGFYSSLFPFLPYLSFYDASLLASLASLGTRKILGVTLSQWRECDSRRPSSSPNWLTGVAFMISPQIGLAYRFSFYFVLSEPSILKSHPYPYVGISAPDFLKQYPDVGWYNTGGRKLSTCPFPGLQASYKCPF